MASMNKVILVGNLTRDPELRRIPSGTAVTEFGLAISENYKNKNGELVETVCFVEIVVWGRQAETSEQYLKKGSPVLIEGRLVFDSWENDKGEKRSKLRVRADRVQFLSSKPRSEEGSSNPGPSADTSARSESEEAPDAPVLNDDQHADPDDLPF